MENLQAIWRSYKGLAGWLFPYLGDSFDYYRERTPMTESSDEQRQKRAERARQNGSKGRGPSAAGAARSKLNGLDWGLRAQTYPLPGEEDADAAAQAQWNAWYGPGSPAAGYHAKQCARASVIADRCERFARARIAEQKRKAVRNFRRRGPRRVKSIMARIPLDRLGSVQALAEFSDGCRKLASILAGSIEFVSSRGYLLPEEIDTVIWAHAIWPVPESLATDATAYTLSILNLGCTPGVAAAERDARLDPASRPLALRDLPREALMPADPKVCTERLRALIQQKCDEYQVEADRLQKECDEPELARMLDEAEFLSDADARRWKRCHAEQRLTFRGSEQALYKALERDREAGDDRNEDPGAAGGASPEPQTPRGECDPPGREGAGRAGEGLGPPLAGGEWVSPTEPRIAPEASPQMMNQREDRAQEAGTGQGVPSCVPGGAGDSHDVAPPPAAPPLIRPPLGAGLPAPSSSGLSFSEALARGGAAALTRPSATLSQGVQGERDWTAAHADPPGGPAPAPAPHTQ